MPHTSTPEQPTPETDNEPFSVCFVPIRSAYVDVYAVCKTREDADRLVEAIKAAKELLGRDIREGTK